MYKVVIVDDEKIVRVALRAIVDWESEGWKLCETVGSGEAALDAIRRHNPDLLITDIVMPGMDGLDLIRSARESGFQGEFVILTNYQNFDYVIEALHNEVLDYIIKTDISAEVVRAVIAKAGEKIAHSGKRRSGDRERNAPDPDDAERLRRHLAHPGGSFALSDRLLALYAFLPSSLLRSPLDIPRGTLSNVVGEAARELQNCLIPLAADSLVILFSASKASELMDRDNRTLSKIRKLVRLYMNAPCGFVLSQPLSRSSDLDAALSRCRRAAHAALYDGLELPIQINSADSFLPGVLKGKEIYADLTHLINECRYDEAKGVTEETADRCRENRIEPEGVSLVFRSIHHLLQMDYRAWFSAQDKERSLAVQPVVLDDYRLELDALIDRIRKSKVDLSCTACRGEIIEIDRFIRSNLGERITLTLLSENVNMSENYISRLFKAETGINIVQYINLIKLEKAKELLLIKDHSVKQVAYMVGYDTSSYFNRLFNKICGINPTEYVQMVETLGEIVKP